MNKTYGDFIFMVVLTTGMFIYENKKRKKYEKISNTKLRFGTLISSIIMVLPLIIALMPEFLINKLQIVLGLKGEKMYIILCCISFVLYIVVLKFIYIPINKDDD